MPVVELDYAHYPFSLTISSLASVAGVLSDEKLRDYRGAFEESVNTEGIYVVIIVRYSTGQSSRTMSSMAFVKPSDVYDPDFDRTLDRMLDQYYTLQVQA